MRILTGIITAAILAPLAACSDGAAPALAPAPTPTSAPAIAPTLTQVPTLAPTPTLEFGLLLNEPESFEGYTLLGMRSSAYAYLIDHQGRLAHPQPSVGSLVRLLDNGNVLTGGNREVDPKGNVVWKYLFPQHHDLLKLPNGNVLILSMEYRSFEEAIDLGANPDSLACSTMRVRAPRIVEARPTGPESAEIIWEWSVFDHLIQDFDPEKTNYGVVADHPERIDLNFALAEAPCKHDGARWMHANALDYNAELDQIMITVRHLSEIWVIDRSTSSEEAAGSAGGNAGKGGDLLYRWGNPRAYGAGTPADQRLFWPHAAHWIPDGLPGAGNVLIFNNGNEHPGFERGHSSVDEVALPYDRRDYRRGTAGAYHPAEIVWTYAADPLGSLYALSRSNAQRLPNHNTLIVDGPSNRIFEVTRGGKVVWDFAYPHYDTQILYRAYRYPPDHPGLRRYLDFMPWSNAAEGEPVMEGEPLVDSLFNLYVDDGYLFYAKEQCGPDDLAHIFYLHILPERADDLQETQRWRGFNNVDLGPSLNFQLRESLSDGKCAGRVPLPDYPIASIRTGQQTWNGDALWTAQFRLNLEPYQTMRRAAIASEPLARSVFDVYAADGALIYMKEQCEQHDAAHLFFLHIIPKRTDDLPEARRQSGFDNLDFDFFLRGALFDGKCIASVPLPDYPISRIRTGQFIRGEGELWAAHVWTNPVDYRTAYRNAVDGDPTARSVFDLYATSGALVYVKEQCEQDDVAHLFFLHIVPKRTDDLPEARRQSGFDNLDFDFFQRGALFDGKCAASVPLPDYAVASIRTGQFIRGEGELWNEEFSMTNVR